MLAMEWWVFEIEVVRCSLCVMGSPTLDSGMLLVMKR
jgi:hypothetical protein